MRVSFLEIYNEELIDLLGAESVENPRLKIYEDATKKVGVANRTWLDHKMLSLGTRRVNWVIISEGYEIVIALICPRLV